MTDILKTRYPHIDGRAWESAGQPLHPVVNPYNGETIAQVQLATAADIDAAIGVAHESQKSWCFHYWTRLARIG